MSDGILRIVVGVDFTEAGDHALDEALRYAWRSELDEVHPVYVLPEGDMATVALQLDEARESLRARVIERCQAVGEAFEQAVVLHVRVGSAAEALHQVAIDVDADLLVVGTHGRRGLSKMLLGSVAEELVRTARLPVLIARPRQLDGLEKSPVPEAARPGEDLHAPRIMASEKLVIDKRPSHIAGLV